MPVLERRADQRVGASVLNNLGCRKLERLADSLDKLDLSPPDKRYLANFTAKLGQTT